ncbi:fructosamine 3 kinase [Parelaphostrongylus tenuis]|uniref:protein-ribulosamine 3-kinase n=1 Tax=Parelaphostrongylus tenuis TaxID=148309 RepID=A0AAD5RCB8_PARTN|nr:fructosamine 3 kinase [Parelaphostrongylus tenuis]
MCRTRLGGRNLVGRSMGNTQWYTMPRDKDSMTEVLEKCLNEELRPFGGSGGGCINSGRGYETHSLGKVYVKSNIKKGAEIMFRGEAASLKAIVATNSVRAPRPINVVNLGAHGWALITEYIDMSGKGSRRALEDLGTQLARMHKHNEESLNASTRAEGFVGGPHINGSSRTGVKQFGFEIATCCGFLPQKNDWCDDWATFFVRNRLKVQIDMLIEKGDRGVLSIWPELERKATSLLSTCGNVVPALVHGDLWSGNWSCNDDGPVIFDPASAFCDPEYEQGIMDMFGGFGSSFWAAYHAVLPERPGRKQRVLLYHLFHCLNHWNHFGSSYRGSSLAMVSEILNS